MYLTEISPLNYRGLNGSMAQVLLTIGIFISYILGHARVFGTEELWPLCFGAVKLHFQLPNVSVQHSA